MTWYRVKVYQADDADMERLVADFYLQAEDGVEVRPHGVSDDVNSHCCGSVDEHKGTGEL